MKRIAMAFAVLLVTATAGMAATMTDIVLQNLRAQGYEIIQVNRTWLGRIWVLTRSKTVQREVVFNPTTGEILRDYAVTIASLEQQLDDEDDGDDGHMVAGGAPDPEAAADPIDADGPFYADDPFASEQSSDVAMEGPFAPVVVRDLPNEPTH